jgi:SAM-dependent methyltransferase
VSQNIHRAFADADHAAPEPMIAFLEVVDAVPEVQAYKWRLRTLLALQPGDAVLDVGCGVGFEACRIAQAYPGVAVIGLDRETMLGTAARHAERLGAGVRWLPGQAEAIPLSDASVDACFTERVLKYLPDPVAGITEMVRVLKPGGRLACFELDYAATLLGGDPAVAGAVGELLNASVGDARMGRRLPGLLHEAGLRELTFEMVAFSPPWIVHEATVGDPVRESIRRNELSAAAAAGLFTVAFVGFLVSGRVPEA